MRKQKIAKAQTPRKARPALPTSIEGRAAENLPSLETGILSLLSFLGHSFKRGTISNELYERERQAALRNLDTLRALESAEGGKDYDEDEEPDERKRQKLLKNKHDIENLLSFLEDSYNEGAISDKSYRELRGENVKKLTRINKLISGETGDATALEAPSDVYEKFGDEAGIGTDEEAEEGNGDGNPERLFPSTQPKRRGDFAVASAPEIEIEPEVKPISFKEKLLRFSPAGNVAQRSEADDILDALRVNPLKEAREDRESLNYGENDSSDGGASGEEEGPGEGQGDKAQSRAPFSSHDGNEDVPSQERSRDFDSDEGPLEETGADDIMQSLRINPRQGKGSADNLSAADMPSAYASTSREAIYQKTGALLGKLGGMVSKFKKSGGKEQGAGAGNAAEGAPDASQSAGGPGASGEGAGQSGQPSWADKLPEEMNPQELAEYNKAMADRSADSQGAGETHEESPIVQQRGGGGGDNEEGGGASSQEVERLVLELEKMKVKLETVENTRSVVEERIEHIMENIGELRTMLFEKESSGKEQEAKLDKFVEMVSDLEPQRFAKELDKRDRQLSEQAMKIEKLETISSDMSQTVAKLRTMLEAIGSLKNIATVSKDIADRSAKIDGTVSKVERLADETGRVYIELNRRLNEFTLYRGKQDIMAESLKELVGMTESMSGKLDNFATRDDAAELKRSVEDNRLMVDELQAKLDLASEGDDLPDHIKDLQEEKEGFEQILESNEEEFLEGKIKEVEYKKMKDLHTKKLQAVRQKLSTELSKMRKERATQGARSEGISKSVSEDDGTPPSDGEADAQAGDEADGALQEAVPEELPSEDIPREAQIPQGKPQKASFAKANAAALPQAPGQKTAAQKNKIAGESIPQPIAASAGKIVTSAKMAKAPSAGKAGAPAPKAITKAAMPPSKASQKPLPITQRQIQKSRLPSVEEDASQESEIEGEADEQVLERAEQTAQTEDEEQEMQEDSEESPEAEPDEADEGISQVQRQPIPAKGRLTASAASSQKMQAGPMPVNIASSQLQKTKYPTPAQKTVPQKGLAAMPALSLKTENPLQSRGGSRIYDIIKGASIGKRVSFIADATTIKKGTSQCLVKLEDDSGVIYGTFASSLKGRVSLQGVVAKDPQGVPYIKISKAA